VSHEPEIEGVPDETTHPPDTAKSDTNSKLSQLGVVAGHDISDSWDADGGEGDLPEDDRADTWDRAAADPGNGDETDMSLETIADALGAPRGDSFLRGVIGGLGLAEAASVALRAPLRRLRGNLRDGVDEAEAFEDFVEALIPGDLDDADLAQAVPLLAALTARAIAQGVAQGGEPIGREAGQHLVREAVTATRHLVQSKGAGGLVLLPHIARGLVRHALRRGIAAAALAEALPRVAGRLLHDPDLARRLTRAGARGKPEVDRPGRWTRGRPRRLLLNGPVEITIIAR
jgi:hypothetical protein